MFNPKFLESLRDSQKNTSNITIGLTKSLLLENHCLCLISKLMKMKITVSLITNL